MVLEGGDILQLTPGAVVRSLKRDAGEASASAHADETLHRGTRRHESIR